MSNLTRHSNLPVTEISINDFKKNPMAAIRKAEGLPVAMLKDNQPVFYCVSADLYERLIDMLDDVELGEMVRDRQNTKEIEISINEL